MGVEKCMTVKTVDICSCGNVMFHLDDYDTFGTDDGLCCPNCGNEVFQTIEQLQAELANKTEAFNDIGQLLVLYPGIAEQKIADRYEKLFQALKEGE